MTSPDFNPSGYWNNAHRALKAMNQDATLSDKINAADMVCISEMFYIPATLVTAWIIHEFSKRESILFQKIQSPLD